LQPKHQQLINTIRDKLITSGRANKGVWPANITDKITDDTYSPMISATCESLVALSDSYTPDIKDLIQQGANFLLHTITSTSNKKWKLSALWALIEIMPYLSDKSRVDIEGQ